MTQSLEGKTAVITGAASGIGLATTQKLLANGCTVVMVDWNEKNVIKTECDKIMICVSHKDNTIPKDREDFKKNETQLAIDLPHFKIIEEMLGVPYIKKLSPI